MLHDKQPGEQREYSTLSIAELLDQAEGQISAGHRPKAVALAREAVARIASVSDSVESQVQTLVRASQVLSDADEDAETVLTCQRALHLIPAHAHATYNVARALKHLGRLAEAESLLDQALVCHPDDLGLLRLKADMLTTRNEHAEAVALLQQVVQDMQKDKIAWFNLSNALLQVRRYSEALEAAERAIALASPPQVADAWVNKGRALEGIGEDVSALAAFHEALRINNAQMQAHYGLELIYERQGQWFQAWRERQYVRWLRFRQQVDAGIAARVRRQELCLRSAP